MAKIGICGYCSGDVHEVVYYEAGDNDMKFVKICLECASTVDENALVQAIRNPTYKMNVNPDAEEILKESREEEWK